MFLFLNSAKSIYEVYSLHATTGEAKKPRSRPEQERIPLVPKGASDPAKVINVLKGHLSAASSKKLGNKLND